MIKLKSLLTEKYLGFGNQGRLNEQQSQMADQLLGFFNDVTGNSNDPAILNCVIKCIKTKIMKDLPNIQERDVDQLIDGLKAGQPIKVVQAISKFTINVGNLAVFIEDIMDPNTCKECEGLQTTPTGGAAKPI